MPLTLYQRQASNNQIQSQSRFYRDLPRVDTSQASTGLLDNIVKAAQDTGVLVAKDYAREQEFIVEKKIIEAEEAFANWQIEYEANNKGMNALNAQRDYQAKAAELMQGALSDYGGGAFNGANIFNDRLSRGLAIMSQKASEAGGKYQERERETFERSELDATISNALRNISANYKDKDSLIVEFEKFDRLAGKVYQGEDYTKQRDTFIASMNESVVIGALAKGDLRYAKQAFGTMQGNDSRLTADQRYSLANRIRAEENRLKAEREAKQAEQAKKDQLLVNQFKVAMQVGQTTGDFTLLKQLRSQYGQDLKNIAQKQTDKAYGIKGAPFGSSGLVLNGANQNPINAPADLNRIETNTQASQANGSQSNKANDSQTSTQASVQDSQAKGQVAQWRSPTELIAQEKQATPTSGQVNSIADAVKVARQGGQALQVDSQTNTQAPTPPNTQSSQANDSQTNTQASGQQDSQTSQANDSQTNTQAKSNYGDLNLYLTDAGRILMQAEATLLLNESVSAFDNLPIKERQAKFNEYKELVLKGYPDPSVKQVLDNYQSSLAKQDQALAKDPAKVSSAGNKDIRDLTQAEVELSMAEQALHFQGTGVKPQVTSKAQRDQITSMLMGEVKSSDLNGGSYTTTGKSSQANGSTLNPVDILSNYETIKNVYGQHTGKALEEAGIPSELRLALNLDNANTRFKHQAIAAATRPFINTDDAVKLEQAKRDLLADVEWLKNLNDFAIANPGLAGIREDVTAYANLFAKMQLAGGDIDKDGWLFGIGKGNITNDSLNESIQNLVDTGKTDNVFISRPVSPKQSLEQYGITAQDEAELVQEKWEETKRYLIDNTDEIGLTKHIDDYAKRYKLNSSLFFKKRVAENYFSQCTILETDEDGVFQVLGPNGKPLAWSNKKDYGKPITIDTKQIRNSQANTSTGFFDNILTFFK